MLTKVLLIDGDKDLIKILSHVLSAQGFELIAKESGSQGMEFLNSDYNFADLALIIIERNLPDIDGIKLVGFCAEKFQRTVPIVFLSELSSDRDIIEGLRSGAIGYIAKPFNLDIFIEKVRSIILWRNTNLKIN